MVARKDGIILSLTIVVLSALFFIYFQSNTYKKTVADLKRKIENSDDLVSQYKSYLNDARLKNDELETKLYADHEAPNVNTTDKGLKIEESVTGKRIISNRNYPMFTFEIPIYMEIQKSVSGYNENFSSLNLTNRLNRNYVDLGRQSIDLTIWEDNLTEDELKHAQAFSFRRDYRNKSGLRIREFDRETMEALPYNEGGYLIYIEDKIIYVGCNQVDLESPTEKDIKNLSRSTEVWKACQSIANTIRPL